jgi:hypothetical protein
MNKKANNKAKPRINLCPMPNNRLVNLYSPIKMIKIGKVKEFGGRGKMNKSLRQDMRVERVDLVISHLRNMT